MNELVKQDAAEVRGMLSAKDWRKAMLIARSVDPTGKGGRPSTLETGANAPVSKVSATEFADEVGVHGWSRRTVIRFLDAWDAAAKADPPLIPPSADMVPGQEVDLPDEKRWAEFYPPGGSDLQDAKPERKQKIEAAAEESGATATTVARFAAEPKGVAGAILADDKAAKAAEEALEARRRKEWEAEVAERRVDAEATIVGMGGRIPTNEEVDPPEEGISATGVAAQVIEDQWKEEKAFDTVSKAISQLAKLGPWESGSPRAEQLQRMSFQLMDMISSSNIPEGAEHR